jgi:hypothetical protein
MLSLNLYCASHEQSRTHLSPNKDAPIHRPIAARGDGRVVAIPQVGDRITGTNAKRPDRVCSSHSHQPESVLAETANDRERDRRPRSRCRKENQRRSFNRNRTRRTRNHVAHPGFDEIQFLVGKAEAPVAVPVALRRPPAPS